MSTITLPTHGNYDHNKEYTNIFTNKKALLDVPVTGYNYIFFTAPELGLTESRFRNGRISAATCFENNQRVLKLPGGGKDSIYTTDMTETLAGEKASHFMSIFTNRAASLPASTEQLATIDYSETWNRYKMPLGTSTKDSKISGNFELLLKEDSELTMMKMHKLWYDYIEGIFLGTLISPHANSIDLSSTQHAIIDYMCSVYTFSLRPDGKTIQYWAKYTGVFPTKNPYEVFASEDGSIEHISKISMDYQFAYKEDMDIAILRDFNLLGQSGSSSNLTDYTGKYHDQAPVSIGKLSKMPGVRKVVSPITNNFVYELILDNPTHSDPEQRNNHSKV